MHHTKITKPDNQIPHSPTLPLTHPGFQGLGRPAERKEDLGAGSNQLPA